MGIDTAAVGASLLGQTPGLTDYDDAPLRLFHLRIGIASSGGVFSDGFGLGVIGIALSHASQLHLSPVWMGLLGGASLFGLFAGSLLTGPAADHFGRRPIFAYNMAVLGSLSLLQGLIGSRPRSSLRCASPSASCSAPTMSSARRC